MAKPKVIISNLPISRVNDFELEGEDPELVKQVIDLYYGALAEKIADDEDFKAISLLYLGSLRPHIGRAKFRLEKTDDPEYAKILENVCKFPNKFTGYKSTLYANPPTRSDE